LNAFTLDYCDLKNKVFLQLFATLCDHLRNEA